MKNNFDFEIKFYEGLIDKKADFVDAIAALAELYTKNGQSDKGLEMDLRLAELKPDDPIVYYNLACSYSLVKKIDLALKTIIKAIACGYTDLPYLQRDKDLLNLRQDKRFQKYFTQLIQKSSK